MGSGKGESKTSPRIVEAKERQAQAIDLRKAGASYAEIAEALGFASASGAHKSVSTALDALVSEPARELLNLELLRLDALFLAIYPDAIKGALGAVDRILKIMERRARLLGIDAPTQIEFTWQAELIELIENGSVTVEEAREELGDDLANEFFAAAGIRLGDSREVETESGENPLEPAENISE